MDAKIIRNCIEYALKKLEGTQVDPEVVNNLKYALRQAENEEYAGWANRETWGMNLFLCDDEYAYKIAKRRGAAGLREYAEERLDELREASPETYIKMIDEIGSLWRVDWKDLADTYSRD